MTTHRQFFARAVSRFLRTLSLLALFAFASSAQGQFSSGSSGADGPFNPTGNVTVTLPASGVFNYTTVNIPAGVTVRYTRNALNTPVTILAQGNVTINGTLDVSSSPPNGRIGGIGGSGGFNGGNGGSFLDSPYGTAGDGPGGGAGGTSSTVNGLGIGGGGGFFQNGNNGGASGGGTGGQGGSRYGTKTLLPLIGGSGAGGNGVNAGSQGVASGGGGGGGAILVASSTSITFGGSSGINANAGVLFNSGLSESIGSGGAIRVVSNTLTGSPCLSVERNGPTVTSGAFGSAGIIRVEGFDLSGLAVRCSTFAITFGQPNPVTLANAPTLRIASIGGVNAPATPIGLINAPPDVVVPTSVSNPVSVVVNGTNLPSGTAIQVKLTPETGDPTTVSGTLTGSTASSSATVNLNLPGGGVSVIRATVTLDVLVALGKPTFINGEKVEKVEVAASFGGTSEVVYITSSGRRVRISELQK